MSASNRSLDFGNIWQGTKVALSGVLSFIAVGFVMSLFLGTPFLAGFFGGLDQFVGWAVLMVAVVYFSYYADGISAGFIITFLVILALLSPVLPGWLTEPFSFVSEYLFGTPDLGLDPVTFAVLSIGGLLAFWYARIRLFGRGKKPGAVVSRMRVNAESISRQYAKAFRVVAAFAAAFVFIFAGATGELFGEVFTMASNAPVVGGFVASIAGYFGAFLTDLPVISSFGPWQYFGVMVALFLIAVGAKYSSALN